MSVTSGYVDSNVFISSLIYEDSRKATNARRTLGMVERGEIEACTSTLTWDEVVWVARRILGKADSVQAGEKLTLFPNLRFVPASEEIIRSAQRLLTDHDLAPRDAIRLASALSRGVDFLISDDPGLDVGGVSSGGVPAPSAGPPAPEPNSNTLAWVDVQADRSSPTRIPPPTSELAVPGNPQERPFPTSTKLRSYVAL